VDAYHVSLCVVSDVDGASALASDGVDVVNELVRGGHFDTSRRPPQLGEWLVARVAGKHGRLGEQDIVREGAESEAAERRAAEGVLR
jgi:hypothetical protein